MRILTAACAVAAVFAAATAQARVTKDVPPGWPQPKPRATEEAEQHIVVDPAIADYKRLPDLAGKVRSVGSSTLSNILNRWADEFKLIYPNIAFDVQGGGSGIAPPALLEGRADLAPMSRPMTDKELGDFQKKFGHAPTRLTVALDAIAIYVNKHNPLKQITLKQLDGVFSISHKRGGEPIKVWGQLGLTDLWSDRAITIKAPARTHGMYTVFKEMVLEGGDYRLDLRAEPVSTSIVQGVGADTTAIGFASYFFSTRRTRALAVAANEGGPFFAPTQQNCLEGKYPLSRLLYVYVNKTSKAPISPAADQFLRFICSKQGQEAAANEGNFPLSAALVTKECLAALQ
jgi:phosphate transport system substrate-binding protein